MIPNTKHLLAFLVAFACFSSISLIAYVRTTDFRETPVGFDKMEEDELFITHGLSRKQVGTVKVGYALHEDPPKVGLFGNHQFQFWNVNAFGISQTENKNENYFFNYWFANLGLPEIRDYLRYLEAAGRLPTDLIILQVTTPNNDNGRYITDYNGELPLDMLHVKSIGELWHVYDGVFSALSGSLQSAFSYSSTLLGLLDTGAGNRIVSDRLCSTPQPDAPDSTWIRFLPHTVKSFAIDSPTEYCDPNVYWSTGLHPDGSSNFEHHSETRLIKNANPLDINSLALSKDDAVRISSFLEEIQEIVENSGAKLAVVIPPVYETRRPSRADKIFDDGIKAFDRSKLYDLRDLRDRKKYFVNYDHPGLAFFETLVSKLSNDGLLPPPTGTQNPGSPVN